MDAARVGARVNIEGMRSVVAESTTWLRVLRDIRRELTAINAEAAKFPSTLGAVAGGGGAGGAAPGVPSPNGLSTYARMGAMTRSFAQPSAVAFGVGAAIAGRALGYGAERFNRNLTESIPISQNDMLLTSQYGRYQYGQVDRQRLVQLGKFGMSRTEAAGAQGIALSYGQSAGQANSFLRNTVAPLVQASGGTMTPTQAAASAASFLDPLTLRRAQSFGITPGKVGGQVGNPLTVAQGYIKDYEQRYGVKMNNIDFENLRSPGSRLRFQFKRLYQLTDESVETIIQAGLQNVNFQSKFGRSIDFSAANDLTKAGLTTSRLGLKSFEFLSASASREAKFFQRQEGSMVGKLQQDINIEDTLSDVEDAFAGLIGPMGEFQRYLKLGVAALQGLAGLSVLRSLSGGGGGPLGAAGGLLGGGGGPGGVGGGAAGGGAGAPGGGVGGGIGGGGRIKPLGLALGAATLYGASNYGAQHGGAGGAAVGIGGSALGGGLMASAAGFGPVGISVAAAGAAAYGAKKYFDGMHARDVNKERTNVSIMTEEELLKAGVLNAFLGTGGAGPKETARYDVFQMRRGAMLSAMLAELNETTDVFSGLSGEQANAVSKMIAGGTSKEITKDTYFNFLKLGYSQIRDKIKKSSAGRDIYEKYFGSLDTPFDLRPAGTDEAASLVLSTKDIIGSATANMGDAVFNKHVGDPVSGKGADGPTWDRLDPQLKGPLSEMLAAAGGRVWLGNGWRSEEQQRNLFLSRHNEDPNGDISWNGRKWKLKRGMAPAAPPGRSMHEIGLAADLEGDLDWVQQNAAKFGLKTFAGVNNEPWHVQPAGLPNSRREYEAGGIAAAEAYANTGSSSADGGLHSGGGGFGGGGPAADSGSGFSIAASRPSGSSGGGGRSMMSGTAGSSTSGPLGGTSGGAGGTYSASDVAQFAYNAGFRGSDLVNFVSIAMRESGGNSGAANEKGLDMSYGLFQINLKPWMDKGLTPPYTKEQLMDPQFNANVAFQYFQQRGMQPWTIKGDWSAKTDRNAAAAAVAAAGLGDGPFAMSGGGGGAPSVVVHMEVNLNSTGQLGYDVNAFAEAASEAVQEKMAMALRRSS